MFVSANLLFFFECLAVAEMICHFKTTMSVLIIPRSPIATSY